jgi:transposase-like protein
MSGKDKIRSIPPAPEPAIIEEGLRHDIRECIAQLDDVVADLKVRRQQVATGGRGPRGSAREGQRGLRLSRAAELVEAAVEETLSYYAFPEEHWRRIRTNNPLERIVRENRRRTCVVGAFPDGQSALNLAAARLRHIAGTAWSTKRYLNIELQKDQQMRDAITA